MEKFPSHDPKTHNNKKIKTKAIVLFHKWNTKSNYICHKMVVHLSIRRETIAIWSYKALKGKNIIAFTFIVRTNAIETRQPKEKKEELGNSRRDLPNNCPDMKRDSIQHQPDG